MIVLSRLRSFSRGLRNTCLPIVAGLCLAASADQVDVSATRLTTEPILGPGQDWSSLAIFDPAAISIANKTVLLFRAQDRNHTSRIGYAESTDGLHFSVRREPVLAPEAEYEKNGGVEDPRVVRIEGTYYLTYTAYDLHSAQLCLATSKDLIHWQRQGVIMPAYKGTWNTQWTKSGAILPVRINSRWWMYYLGTRKDADGTSRDYMGLASSDDLLHWSDATDKPVLDRRSHAFDSRVMEPGPAPFLTSAGILLLYNGADENLVYGPGWVLFDARNPGQVIARAERPFVQPSLSWERFGTVPNVIFLEGAIGTGARSGSIKNKIELTGYYGAADKYIGAIEIDISLNSLRPQSATRNRDLR